MNILIILVLSIVVLYVGGGFFVTFINALGKGDTFKTDWKKILTWPKELF